MDHHLVRKYFDRGSDEYRETLDVYKQNTKKVLISSNMEKQKIHNVRDLLKYINKINKKFTSSSNMHKMVNNIKKVWKEADINTGISKFKSETLIKTEQF